MADKKIKILVIDDEESILKSIERSFSLGADNFELKLLSTLKNVDNILSDNIDLILTDINIPGEDTIAFFKLLKEKYPKIIRIAMTGVADRDIVMKLGSSVHQYIAKPINFDHLRQRIDHLIFLRNEMDNEDLMSFISGIENLPSLPEIYFKLEELIKSDDYSFNDVVKIINKDAALTASILHTVNSSMFSLKYHVNDLKQAVSFLGVNIIKSLALSLKIFFETKVNAHLRPYIETLWKRSATEGEYARAVAKIIFNDKLMIDEAYIAGLLCNVGKLALISVPNHLENISKLMVEEPLAQTEAEVRLYGKHSSLVGAYLLSLWGFSDRIVEAAAFYNNPENVPHPQKSILTCVHIAYALQFDTPEYNMEYLKSIGITDTTPFDAIKPVEA